MGKKSEDLAKLYYGKDLQVMDVGGKPIYTDKSAFTMILDPDNPIEFLKTSNIKINPKSDMSVMCQVYDTGGSGDFLYDLDGVFVNKGLLDGLNEFVTENNIDADILVNNQEKMNPVVIKGKDVVIAVAPMRKSKGKFYAKGTLTDFKKLTKKTMKQLREEILTHDNHTFQGKKEQDKLGRDSKDTLVCKRMFLDKDVYIEDE